MAFPYCLGLSTLDLCDCYKLFLLLLISNVTVLDQNHRRMLRLLYIVIFFYEWYVSSQKYAILHGVIDIIIVLAADCLP